MGKAKLAVFGLAAAAGVAVAHSKKKIDVKNVGKMAVNAVKLPVPETDEYPADRSLTPPMGWSSWNLFRTKINEDLIYEIGCAMKNSGLLDAGYKYINLDDCWQSSLRDENGKLQGDLESFPSGIKALCEKVNKLGLKLGIYSSNGTFTCEDLPASLGKEALDADTFAEWGIEYFKYDFCHNKGIPQRAPCIEKLIITDDNGFMTEILAEDAVLMGAARIVEDKKLGTGKYIDGISAALGSAEFCCEVPADGVYNLTLGVRKKSNANKFAQIKINDKSTYEVTLPPTWAHTKDGRHQIKVMLKEGFNIIRINNPVASRQVSSAMQYINMGKEIQRATREYAEKNGVAEKPICYSVCEWGLNFPWKWGAKAGNLWRTTMDIKPFWLSVLSIYEFNVRLDKYASLGHWNDPDMLEVGNGNLTFEENKSHFTLWCMMAAPLILGNDIRDFVKEDGTPDYDNEIYKIVTNRELIAIDQDSLGVQCNRISTGIVDTLVKPLAGGEVAVCVFNKSADKTCSSVDIKDIASRTSAIEVADLYTCKEIWEETVYETDGMLYFEIPSHGVKVFRIKVKED